MHIDDGVKQWLLAHQLKEVESSHNSGGIPLICSCITVYRVIKLHFTLNTEYVGLLEGTPTL